MKRTIPIIGMLLLLAVCLFLAGCNNTEKVPDDTNISDETVTESVSDSGTAEKPSVPSKRPGVDNNPVNPPKTPDTDSTTEAPDQPVGPTDNDPDKNELPPIWIEQTEDV